MSETATIEQLRAFVAVSDSGSFSAAGRKLGRAQSNISRSVGLLEREWGLVLFDRGGRAAELTPGGAAMLSEARTLVERFDGLAGRAQRWADTDEHEVSLVVDGIFPVHALVTLSDGFQRAFPEVSLKLRTENLGAVVAAVADRSAMIGVSSPVAERVPGLRRRHIGEVRLVTVCAPTHPLAELSGRLPIETLQTQVQIVLSDRSTLTRGVELAVLGNRTLTVADLGTKLALISAGIGWGNLPEHMVVDALSQNTLTLLAPEPWGPNEHILGLTRVVRAEFAPGPASSWVLDELERVCGTPQQR
ncbi:MAG TPA: LysR family transcriptional regulator [Polyangiaceae bacterium]